MKKDIRKLLQDLLNLSLNTDQMNHLAREVDAKFDLYKITGYNRSMRVPPQFAARSVIEFFADEQSLLRFIAFMMQRDGHGASGGVIRLRPQGKENLLRAIEDLGWIFDDKTCAFIRDQSTTRTTDWGFLNEGEEYYLCFASIDIVSSSQLIETNMRVDVDSTMSRLRAYIRNNVESKNGRIWTWYGDGGVAAFHGPSCNADCVFSIISMLAYLPIFNILENELRPENDLKIRVGVHSGKAVYHTDVGQITGEDFHLAQEVEKSHCEPNSMAITAAVFKQLSEELRSFFYQSSSVRGLEVYSYHPGQWPKG